MLPIPFWVILLLQSTTTQLAFWGASVSPVPCLPPQLGEGGVGGGVCGIYKNKKQYCKLYTYSITAVWCCQMSLWLFLSLKNVTSPSTTEYFISISWDGPWVCPRTWKMILTPGWAILCFVGTGDESGLLVKGLWMSIHTHRLMCQWGREDDTLSPSRVQVYDRSLRKPLIQVRGGSR